MAIRNSDLLLADEMIGKDLRTTDEQAKRAFLLSYLEDMIILARTALKESIGDETDLQRRADSFAIKR